MRAFVVLLFTVFFAGPLHATGALESIRLCDDNNIYPPYSYLPANSRDTESALIGAMPDLLQAVERLTGKPCRIVRSSWENCIKGSADFDGVMHASLNTQRLTQYYATPPIYRAHMALFYNHLYHNNLQIIALDDLKGYRLCGLTHHNYDLSQNVNFDIYINASVKTIEEAFLKLKNQECDIFINLLEYNLSLPPEIHYYIPHDLPMRNYHMLINKETPHALEIYALLNQAILQLHHNGQLRSIFEKHTPTGTGF